MLMMQSYSPPKPIKNIQFSGRLTLLLTIVEISDCLTRTIRKFQTNSTKLGGHKTGLCESSDFECKCHKLDCFGWVFFGVVWISVCTDMYMQALLIILMSVLVNIIIYDISKYGLGRKGPVQVIYVNEVETDKYWVLLHVALNEDNSNSLSKIMLLILHAYLFVWHFVDSVCAEWHERKCHWHHLAKHANSNIWKYSGCKVEVKAKFPGA